MPVVPADSQSTLPHAHAAELAADPSDTEHAGGREQARVDEELLEPRLARDRGRARVRVGIRVRGRVIVRVWK